MHSNVHGKLLFLIVITKAYLMHIKKIDNFG